VIKGGLGRSRLAKDGEPGRDIRQLKTESSQKAYNSSSNVLLALQICNAGSKTQKKEVKTAIATA
jgi:hypothetical protein